jgi:hypothetical protein
MTMPRQNSSKIRIRKSKEPDVINPKLFKYGELNLELSLLYCMNVRLLNRVISFAGLFQH